MRKFDPRALPYIAAIAQAAQYAHAGYIFFGWVGLGIGIFLGVPVSLSAVTAASKINDIAKKRKLSAWIALVLLFIISPAIIGISVYQEMNVADNIARGFASALWGLSADLAVGLTGFIIGGGLVEKETKKESAPQPPRKKKKVAQPITDTQLQKYWLRNPEATNTEVAQHFGVTRQAISKRREKLYSIGER